MYGVRNVQPHEPGFQGLGFRDSVLPEYQDPFEMHLLRSPCLYSLSMFHHAKRVESHEIVVEPVFQLITMAPNLTHIDLMGVATDGDGLTRNNQS